MEEEALEQKRARKAELERARYAKKKKEKEELQKRLDELQKEQEEKRIKERQKKAKWRAKMKQENATAQDGSSGVSGYAEMTQGGLPIGMMHQQQHPSPPVSSEYYCAPRSFAIEKPYNGAFICPTL